MQFHTSKCQVIYITNKVKPIIGNYQIKSKSNHILEQVHCAKYLGTYRLQASFNTHVEAIVKQANSTHAFLARNIARCCSKVKQMAYATYIRPIVEYVSAVLDRHTKHNTNKIEMIQRRCARYVAGNIDHTSSVTSLHNCLNWPTLEERRHQNRLAVMYRILHNQVDTHWQLFLTKTSYFTSDHSCRHFAPFCRNHVYAFFSLPLVKTGITLPSIQLTHHALTTLSGS